VSRPFRWTRALACAIAIAAAYLATPALFDLDDAYIALHGAEVAVRGGDAVYGAPALAGATSPAYVGVLIAALLTGVEGLQALRLVSALGLAAYAFALLQLGRALDLPARRTAVLVVTTLGSGLVLMQATNGLETGWALALATALIAAAASAGSVYFTAAGAAMLPFLRPELLPASALLLLYALGDAGWRDRLKAVAIALAVSAPLVLWIRVDTGAWVPQTIQAKQLFFAQACGELPLKAAVVFAAVSRFLIMVAPLAIGAIALVRDRLGRYGAVACVATLAAFAMRFPGGLSHNDSRYLYAILAPWLSYGVALRLRDGGVLGSMPALTAIAVATCAVWPFIQPPRQDAARELVNTAMWVDTNVPADAVVLVHDAGAISTFAHRRAVDLVGLKTPSSIEAHRRLTAPSCGRDRPAAIADIAAASHASYAVLVSDWDATFEIRRGLEANGFVLTPLRTPPSHARGYTVYRLEASSAAGFGVRGSEFGVPGSVVRGSLVPGSVVRGSLVPGSVVRGSLVPGSLVPGSLVQGSSSSQDRFQAPSNQNRRTQNQNQNRRTQNQNHRTQNQNQNPEPRTQNPEPRTPNPEPERDSRVAAAEAIP
jgi:hypothetical protein